MISSRLYITIECVILTLGIPVAFYLHNPGSALIPLLWAITAYCYFLHRKLAPNPEAIGWDWAALRDWPLVKPLLLRFAASAAALVAFASVAYPEKLFGFMLQKPYVWAAVMLLYPLLSVIPQEIIFRRFFFDRYPGLFPKPWHMVLASGFTFGFAHILFHNWVAPLLCAIGGMYFAKTYQKRPSLALVVVEHALYGCFLFTLGLGHYFYHGAVR